MLKYLTVAAVLVGLAGPQCAAAQTSGVRDIAPGVREVDGAKVPSQTLDATALEAAIKEKKSLRAAKKLLGGNGIVSEGPAGTRTYMYKVHDTATDKDMVAILFVKGDQIVDYLIQ